VIYSADLPKFTGLSGETNPEKMRGLLNRDRAHGANLKIIENDYLWEKFKNCSASMRGTNKPDLANDWAEEAIAAINKMIANYRALLGAPVGSEKQRKNWEELIVFHQDNIRGTREIADERIRELEERAKAKDILSALDDLEAPQNILIDFSVYPENHGNAEPIELERGLVKNIPLVIEAPNDAEGTLQMQLRPDTIEPEVLDAELSQSTVVLSRLDLTEGKVTRLTEDIGIREAGTLTLDLPTSLQPGEYSFMIEARQLRVAGGPAYTVGSGTMIYVTVK
jgi:hypothetical protein